MKNVPRSFRIQNHPETIRPQGSSDRKVVKIFRPILLLVALFTCLAPANSSAANIQVANANDAGPGSLRQAIIDFSAPGVIDFAPGVFTASSNTITLSSEMVVSKAVTIDASGTPSGVTLSGGGLTRLFSVSGAGDLTLIRLKLTAGNSAGAVANGFGGAIYNAGQLNLENCIFTGSTSVNYGGAVSSIGGLNVTGCTVSANTAGSLGGGIYSASSGNLTITNTTITGNTAFLFGGGVYHTSALTLIHATLTANHAGNKGGGVYNDFSSALTLRSSIVAGNTAPESENFFGPFTVSASNLTSGDPKLAPLGDYGGLTPTMPPQPDSPAIDHAVNEGLVTDQRGFPRALGAASDIGAAELEVSGYNPAGLTLHTRVPTGDSAGFFEISTDPQFSPVVGTFAGTGVVGDLNGARASSEFALPTAVAKDAFGNIFVADSGNQQIRMIDSAGNVTSIAGSGPFSGLANGPGPDAKFSFPSAVAVGPDGNVYVADTFNHRICKLVRPAIVGGVWMVETLAGPNSPGNAGFLNQSGSAARFNYPYGIALDSAGNVFVADALNHRIRKITPTGGVSTYAGSGTDGMIDTTTAPPLITDPPYTPLTARFDTPRAVCLIGSTLYVADSGNHRIREITSGGSLASTVTTFAGSTIGDVDGNGASAKFNSPSGITTDGVGVLYVADEQNHKIRKIVVSSQGVTTVAGSGVAGFLEGKSDVAQFDSPTGVIIGPDGNLIVADGENDRLRRIIIQNTKMVSTAIVGDIISGMQQVTATIHADALGLDPGALYYIRWVSSTSVTQSLGLRFTLYEIPVLSTEPASHIIPTAARLNANVDPKNNLTDVIFEYSTDPDLLPPYGVSTLAGSTAAGLTGASGIVSDGSGGAYIADRANHRILRVSALGVVTTFAGSGVAGFSNANGILSQFENPNGLARDGAGNLYVADEANHCIRKITPGGDVTTFVGSGVAGFANGAAASAKFLYPAGVAVDAAGNLFIADMGNQRIRQFSISTGDVTTLAGTGVAGITADGNASTAQFSSPRGIAVNAAGTHVWVADTLNHRVRLILSGSAFSIAGDGTAAFADGLGNAAQFSSPTGIALSADGVAYVSDSGNHRIRQVKADGTVTTLAGSGIAGTIDSPVTGAGLYPATATQFSSPTGISIDSSGHLLVTQASLARTVARAAELPVATVTPRTNGIGPRLVFAEVPQPLLPNSAYYFRAVATNYRGTVTGEMLSFVTPQAGITVADGPTAITNNQLTPVDLGNTPTGQPVVRQITISNPGSFPLSISDIALPAGYLLAAGPWTINPLASLNLGFTLTAATAETYSGNIVVTSNAIGQPTFTFPITGVVLDPPAVVTLAATAVTGTSATLNATVNPNGSSTTAWFEWSLDPEFDGLTVSTRAATLNQPNGIATDSAGNCYIADTLNHRVLKITSSGTTTTLAGTGSAGFADGAGNVAQFNEPVGIVAANGMIYVADSKNHRIRAITAAGVVSTFAGLGTPGFTDGVPEAARFNLPSGLAIDPNGALHVADRANHRIRKVGPDGTVSTLAGLAAAGPTNGLVGVAQFDNPIGIAVDAAGNTFVTEASSHAIRLVAANGSTSIFAGSHVTPGTTNATGTDARFTSPVGLAFQVDGTLLVADKGNHFIRSISPAGVVSTYVGSGTAGNADGLGEVAQFDQPISLATTPTGGVLVGEIAHITLREIVSTQVIVQAATGLTGTDPLSVETALTDLVPGLQYYFRAIATNGGGTTIGTYLSFGGDPFIAWQSAKFGPDAGNPAIAGPGAEPAGDGICNLLKYAFYLDPWVPGQDGLPTMALGSGELSITYTKVLAATNLVYTPQWSGNLVDWFPTGITEQIFPDNGTTFEVRASIPSTPGGAKFLRVKVSMQQP